MKKIQKQIAKEKQRVAEKKEDAAKRKLEKAESSGQLFNHCTQLTHL